MPYYGIVFYFFEEPGKCFFVKTYAGFLIPNASSGCTPLLSVFIQHCIHIYLYAKKCGAVAVSNYKSQRLPVMLILYGRFSSGKDMLNNLHKNLLLMNGIPYPGKYRVYVNISIAETEKNAYWRYHQ